MPTFENSLLVSKKQNIHLPHDPTILHKDLNTNVHSSFICNNKKLETTQMPINEWIVKQTVIYPYYGIFLNNKNERSNDTHNSKDES